MNEPLQENDSQRRAPAPPEGWRIGASIAAFLAALLFPLIGLAAESAGAHWFVGVMCVTGTFLCVAICLRLPGLTLKHFLPTE